MNYEYAGYLSTILYKPNPEVRESLDAVVFTQDDIARWRTEDMNYASEWREVPARKTVTDSGVRIEGNFSDVVGIDSLSPNDPRYWAPLSTVGIGDDRFPIDCAKYPVVEITYRCTSDRAHPTWLWTYDGGSHFGALPKSTEWTTVARNVQYFGFPKFVDNVIVRLYSGRRSVESMEVQSIRFRAMSHTEAEAFRKSQVQLEERKRNEHFDELDDFMPLGVYMDAQTARRLSKMLSISVHEYWELVCQDLVTHHHNSVALAHVDGLKRKDWNDLLKLGEKYGVKFVPRHQFPVGGIEEDQERVIEKHIRPYADSKSILARSFSGEPIESDFHQVLSAKRRIEAADPNHPVAIIARYPNAYPLFAPFFSVSGVGHFTSRRPWDLGDMVRTTAQLGNAQQFWVAAPAFQYPTQTPEWSSCPEMRLMVNLALANGARGWFAYSYHNDPMWLRGRIQRTLTGPFLTFSDLWSELMQRMKLASALAPLFLKARPSDSLDPWFVESYKSELQTEPSPGVPPISQYQLEGPDYTLYMTINNNVREISGVNVEVPRKVLDGLKLYDLSRFVRERNWGAMPEKLHIEMFPGQAHLMLATRSNEAEALRNLVTQRFIYNDTRKLNISLQLARTYGLPVANIEALIQEAQKGEGHERLDAIHSAKDELINLTYSTPAIAQARSKIVEASSAICACDGTLCRLMTRGQKGIARELGAHVIPLAAEFTNLRLELRRGNGAKILEQCEDLSNRVLTLLDRIRSTPR